MTRIGQEKQWEITKLTEGWGEILREFTNEDGRKVRIFANGCSTIGEPNPAANSNLVNMGCKISREQMGSTKR